MAAEGDATSVGGDGPGLILFDCDGVLVDSEPISLRVMREIANEAGAAIDAAEAQRLFLGKSLASACDLLREGHGVILDASALASLRERLYAAFRADLRPTPGVAEALDALDGPRCVASSSQPERIRLSLEIAGLYGRLAPHLFSATMVERGKPAPDLFLHAAARMGVAPADCLVIEDSPAGIEAARRAGMRVFAFTGAGHARNAPHRAAVAACGPDLVFDEMRALPELAAGFRSPPAAKGPRRDAGG